MRLGTLVLVAIVAFPAVASAQRRFFVIPKKLPVVQKTQHFDHIDQLIDAADPAKSANFHWTKQIAANPGSDWGYYGQVEVARERQAALGRLSQAKDHLKTLADGEHAPSAKQLAARLQRIDQVSQQIGVTVRGIKAGQLGEMMRFEEAGRSTAITLEGVREILRGP